MTFPFALSRMILLFFIVISNVISFGLSVVAFHERTGGGLQILGICFNVLSLLTIIGCLCHQLSSQNEEASNARNLGMFSTCGLLSAALAISLTVHAQQDGGMGICHDFAHARSPCVHAGVQIGMTYVASLLALIGFIASWIDKFPGAVEVTPRYPITKAPSSHFAAYAHDLDESYTHPPMKMLSRSRNNSQWSDVPLNC